MSLITARFQKSKSDGYTTIFVQSQPVEDLVKAMVNGRTARLSLDNWEFKKAGASRWSGTVDYHAVQLDSFVPCGFPYHPSWPIMMANGVGALTGIIISSVGLGSGVTFRTRSPQSVSILREAATGLEAGVIKMFEMSKAIDITVTGIQKPAPLTGAVHAER